jgi:hypothetical protein
VDPKEFLINRAFDDSSAIASGAQADTYYDDDTRLKPTPEIIEAQRLLEQGEINQSEFDDLLNRIASRLKS